MRTTQRDKKWKNHFLWQRWTPIGTKPKAVYDEKDISVWSLPQKMLFNFTNPTVLNFTITLLHSMLYDVCQ